MKIGLDFQHKVVYNTHIKGHLAQLAEHSLDVRRVSGSSPLMSTINKRIAFAILLFICIANVDGLEPRNCSSFASAKGTKNCCPTTVERSEAVKSVNVHHK